MAAYSLRPLRPRTVSCTTSSRVSARSPYQSQETHLFNQQIDETHIVDETAFVFYLRLISSGHRTTHFNQRSHQSRTLSVGTVDDTFILDESNPNHNINTQLRSNITSRGPTNGFSREKIRRLLRIRRCVGVKDEEICVVCQDEYEQDERIGKLGCGHEYHVDCISRWLSQKKFCPICKAEAF